ATLAGETSFEWAVPDVDEPDCRIRVVCVDAESNEGSDISDADFSIVDVSGVEGQQEIPVSLILRRSRPNPFAGMTRIEFGLPTAQRVTLGIYNIKGQLIKTLAAGEYSPGFHTVVWRGKNAQGEKVSSGLYFYRLVTDGKVLKQKMLYLN
ncbi:MAG: T9SS type A sorting domain-containing protein, partial [Candidatus Eisenbacteria bacterium]|nr:T9SS type A sorting domain-containing protein [Candidatus Eisenbacteria bacterium]